MGKVRKGNKKTGGVGWDRVGSAQRCMSPALVSSFGGSITSLIFDNKILQVLQIALARHFQSRHLKVILLPSIFHS